MSGILVIKLGALGDFVQASLAIEAIATAHAGDKLTLLTTPPYEELGSALGCFDAIWTDGRPKSIGDHIKLIARMRAAGFDRVYDLQTSSRSSWYFQALRPNPPEWSGIAAGCSHPHANPERAQMHTIDRQAEQLAVLGLTMPRKWSGQLAPDLRALPLQAGVEIERFSLESDFAVLVPGGAPHRPAKRWPADAYSALAEHFSRCGLQPLIVGGPAEAELANVILRACPAARSLVGQTSFLDIVTLGIGARVAVGNDTGPMHLIAASGCPSLVLFSDESDPARCAARGARVETMKVPDLRDLLPADVVARVDGRLLA